AQAGRRPEGGTISTGNASARWRVAHRVYRVPLEAGRLTFVTTFRRATSVEEHAALTVTGRGPQAPGAARHRGAPHPRPQAVRDLVAVGLARETGHPGRGGEEKEEAEGAAAELLAPPAGRGPEAGE